ncbi:MAG: hypothetical protein NTV51_11185 [Verrucomicrobia bacterium]|nr:hypothetical protein [Verrucomicrobiota bacterium]
MSIPIILADFGPAFFTFLCILLSLPLVFAIVSITVGIRKKGGQRSMLGVVLGAISIAGAACFLSCEPPDWASPFWYLAVLPLPLSLIGSALCLRKKQPNQPPEPTAGRAPGRGSS